MEQLRRPCAGGHPSPSPLPEGEGELCRYIARKQAELRLFDADVPPPSNPELLAEAKFRAAAALKARRICGTWRLTETHWSDAPAGAQSYAYQRADLETGFPLPYDRALIERHHRVAWSGYVASGMAALSMLAVALGQIRPGARMALPPLPYPETGELLARYGAALGIAPSEYGPTTVRLIDSGAGSAGVERQAQDLAGAEMVVFDTTCLAAGSGRIASVLRRARHLPCALARSHTKLDSLGVEYGRLGSVVLLAPDAAALTPLVAALHDAVRLFGTAPVPAHVPPFAGTPEWRALSRRRIANIVRGNRRAARALRDALAPSWAARCHPHGLFLTLDDGAHRAEADARARAAAMVAALRAAGVPAHQAGSFGFDFAVADAFPAAEGDGFILRLAVGDLSARHLGRLIDAVRRWGAAPTSV